MSCASPLRARAEMLSRYPGAKKWNELMSTKEFGHLVENDTFSFVDLRQDAQVRHKYSSCPRCQCGVRKVLRTSMACYHLSIACCVAQRSPVKSHAAAVSTPYPHATRFAGAMTSSSVGSWGLSISSAILCVAASRTLRRSFAM